jgi:hypothetical protein
MLGGIQQMARALEDTLQSLICSGLLHLYTSIGLDSFLLILGLEWCAISASVDEVVEISETNRV